ncbi:hypothetical protein HRbin01_00061 [archaeon HR01]|nr:hypothetical protein HRbin01_00061 [archaeon HR01]
MAILYGVVGGFLYGLTGYLKSGEAFEAVKFLKTLALGVAVGLFNTLAGVPMDLEAAAALASAGEVAVLENIIKSMVRFSRL